MKRHLMHQTLGVAATLLLISVVSVEAKTAARVEYRDGRVGVAVIAGDLPVRVVHPQPRAIGWLAADIGPVRVMVGTSRPYWSRQPLQRYELRHLLGRDTVRMLERHARTIGHRGPLEGRWYRANRHTVVLEVTARGAPVATLHDRGANGVFERIYLAPATVVCRR